MPPNLVEREINLYLRVDFNWLAVEQIRFVLPTLNSFQRRGREHGVAADKFDMDNVAFFVDFDVEQDYALDVLFAGFARIGRVDFTND